VCQIRLNYIRTLNFNLELNIRITILTILKIKNETEALEESVGAVSCDGTP
jgi:hypothetical protein